MDKNGFKYYKELVGSNAKEDDDDEADYDDDDEASGEHIPLTHLHALLGR